MDYSKKPDRKNPRKGANLLSQLLFLWIVPVMFRVSWLLGEEARSLLHNNLIRLIKFLLPSFHLSSLRYIYFKRCQRKGCFHGLNREDLSKCLKKDRSEDLGDKLEM